jgi:hypothetical protein
MAFNIRFSAGIVGIFPEYVKIEKHHSLCISALGCVKIFVESGGVGIGVLFNAAVDGSGREAGNQF